MIGGHIFTDLQVRYAQQGLKSKSKLESLGRLDQFAARRVFFCGGSVHN
jgi:hypothetical protein